LNFVDLCDPHNIGDNDGTVNRPSFFPCRSECRWPSKDPEIQTIGNDGEPPAPAIIEEYLRNFVSRVLDRVFLLTRADETAKH